MPMWLIYFEVAMVLLHLVVIFGFVLTERRDPSTTMAWLITVLLFPIVGILAYFTFRRPKMKKMRRKSKRVTKQLKEVMAQHRISEIIPDLDSAKNLDPRTKYLIRLGEGVDELPAGIGNRCTLLSSGSAAYKSMLEAIEGAEEHIHAEFYIIRSDITGRSFRDHLVKKARQGVEVRVIGDAVGCAYLPREFWKPLREAGGKVAVFNPILRVPFRHRDRVDYRNHRKIVVVDGRLGFTGGINVGKEYLGLDPDVGHWRDTHIAIEGPAVLNLQETFAEDWLMATGELLDDPKHYPVPLDPSPGEALVDIVSSGPDTQWASIHRIYFQAIAMANQRVWITSPYFVPDPIIEEALITASLRGIDVRLLIPKNPDSQLVAFASRSYLPPLLEAGARIFEYKRGFIHAKTMIVDDWMGTVGSANMDIRSFKLNFELNAFVYEDREFVENLARDFLDDLENSEEIKAETFQQMSYFLKLRFSLARLLSPLL